MRETLLDLGRRAIPGSRVTGGEVIETGWDNRVLTATVDGRPWIFRFPRRPEVALEAAREAAVLHVVASRLPVLVPDWRVHTELDGRTVIGYPALPGRPAGDEPLSDGDFVFDIELPPPPRFAVSLGATLAALHTTPLDLLPPIALPQPERPALAADLERLIALTEVPVPVEHRWRSWLADDELWPEPTVVVHGDVHPGHLFVDDDGDLVGIIDWTDARIGCPAMDFIDPRHAFGASFSDAVVTAYAEAGAPVPARFADQILMRQSLGPLGALLFGLDNERPALTRRARRRLADQARRLTSGLPPV